MRRVVTGWSADGKPILLFDGEPAHFDFGMVSSDEIWSTTAVPADSRRSDDPTSAGFVLEPPHGGTVCRIASYRPGASVELHATQTVDYVIVLAGELTMLYGDDEIVLRPGDIVVQQGTPHGWANRANTDCVVAAILLTAEGAAEREGLEWP
ncbi:MAG: cupin protein [Actinomycetia bacterium]|nr:cupin protein [Actinomycetes bacterium]